jgi:hypothetical protein
MVSNLTKEVTHLKEDNSLLKQELKNLHQVIETSPRLPPEFIVKEQFILPAEVSRKGSSSVVRVPTAVMSTEAQMLSWYPNSTLLRFSVCFTCSPPNSNFKIFV